MKYSRTTLPNERNEDNCEIGQRVIFENLNVSRDRTAKNYERGTWPAARDRKIDLETAIAFAIYTIAFTFVNIVKRSMFSHVRRVSFYWSELFGLADAFALIKLLKKDALTRSFLENCQYSEFSNGDF